MKAKSILKQYLIVATATLSFAGCDVKDPIYNTAHPDHGTVTLTTDWSAIGAGLTAPESYTVSVALAGKTTPATATSAATSVATTSAAGYSATLTGAVNRIDHLFEPGTYRFLVYNTAEHITVSGTTATVSEASGNVDGAGKFIQSAPGWLFASLSELSIAADAEHALTAAMQQQVRRLTLIIEPTGGTTDRIDRIEGYLTGVASTLDLATGTHADPLNAELQFAKITSGANAGKYAATVRLLGIAGEQQELNTIIHFTDGNPKAMSLTSDLTTELAAFNADKRTPLTLGGSIVETPTEAGFTATITDWETVTGGPVVAD